MAVRDLLVEFLQGELVGVCGGLEHGAGLVVLAARVGRDAVGGGFEVDHWLIVGLLADAEDVLAVDPGFGVYRDDGASTWWLDLVPLGVHGREQVRGFLADLPCGHSHP